MSETEIVACLRVTTDEEHADELCWTLEHSQATAIETRDPSTMSAEQQGRVLMLAGFADAPARDDAREAVADRACAIEVAAIDVGDDGWSAGWREFYQPVVLRQIEVLTTWMEPSAGSRSAIVIDPGRAFGTGGHASTRLVLEMLEQRSIARRPLDEILDVGTGSGVLAIAAIKLGANRAVAVDNDPEAVEAACENARRNDVDHLVDVRLAEPGDLEQAHRLVLANIDLAAFKRCAAEIADLVSTDGEALISGLLDEQVPECLTLWPGFEITAQRTRDGWSALMLRRRR